MKRQDDYNKLGRMLMEAVIIFFIYMERLRKIKKIQNKYFSLSSIIDVHAS
jgi:hypothetical protein